MGPRIVHTGTIWVAYAQAYVQCTDDAPMPDRAFDGQRNGLCGAAVPGALFLRTGTHTGRVGFTVEAHNAAPPVDDEWEEVVEATFVPVSPDARLVEWGGGSGSPVDLGLDERPWRVRYCAIGMDAGHGAGPAQDGEASVDRYLLQFWPAPPDGDQIVRQTSQQAAYWHSHAQLRPASPIEAHGPTAVAPGDPRPVQIVEAEESPPVREARRLFGHG